MASEDKMAQVEAWLPNRKPRRIIQNQIVIQLLIVFGIIFNVILATLPFYAILVFPLTALCIIVVDLVATIIYICFSVYRKMYMRLHP